MIRRTKGQFRRFILHIRIGIPKICNNILESTHGEVILLLRESDEHFLHFILQCSLQDVVHYIRWQTLSGVKPHKAVEDGVMGQTICCCNTAGK